MVQDSGSHKCNAGCSAQNGADAKDMLHQEGEVCPVCQEPLGQELAMMPCGHQLCVRCHMALVDRVVPGPKVSAAARTSFGSV